MKVKTSASIFTLICAFNAFKLSLQSKFIKGLISTSVWEGMDKKSYQLAQNYTTACSALCKSTGNCFLFLFAIQDKICYLTDVNSFVSPLPGEHTLEVQYDITSLFSSDASWTEWVAYSCSVQCGIGTKSYYRYWREGTNGGLNMPSPSGLSDEIIYEECVGSVSPTAEGCPISMNDYRESYDEYVNCYTEDGNTTIQGISLLYNDKPNATGIIGIKFKCDQVERVIGEDGNFPPYKTCTGGAFSAVQYTYDRYKSYYDQDYGRFECLSFQCVGSDDWLDFDCPNNDYSLYTSSKSCWENYTVPTESRTTDHYAGMYGAHMYHIYDSSNSTVLSGFFIRCDKLSSFVGVSLPQ